MYKFVSEQYNITINQSTTTATFLVMFNIDNEEMSN